MKKLLILLLTLVLSLSAFSLFGCNGPENPQNPQKPSIEVEGTEGLTYSVLNDVSGNKYASFTGVSSSCTEKDIVIASHYQGYEVSEIGGLMGALSGVKNIESIKVHKYVTSIAPSAFAKAENLITITFDEDCEFISIGSSAFKNLKKLENFNYYGDLYSIGESVFEGCDAMKTTNYVGATYIGNDVNPYLILYKGLNEETVKVHKDCQAIHSNAFLANSNLKTIDFEKDDVLRTISSNAFTASVEKNAENKEVILEPAPQIVNVSIPSTVTTIGDNAFKYCKELKKVTFKENSECASIGSLAFAYCDKLEEVENFEKTQILEIFEGLLYKNASLKYIKIPKTATKIKKNFMWGCSNVTSIEFDKEANLVEIEYHAFRGCSSLKQIIIPKKVEKIGYDILAWIPNLTIYCEITAVTSNYYPLRWNQYKSGSTLEETMHKTYFYSATSKSGCWRYVNGEPTLW